jgi:hypothetical protein
MFLDREESPLYTLVCHTRPPAPRPPLLATPQWNHTHIHKSRDTLHVTPRPTRHDTTHNSSVHLAGEVVYLVYAAYCL